MDMQGYAKVSSGSAESDSAPSKKDFTYHEDKVSEGPKIDQGYSEDYQCFTSRKRNNGYYSFMLIDEETATSDILYGWKIHISLEDFDSVRKAWNLVFPLLMHKRVDEFKIRFPAPPADSTFQEGKDIVIYYSSSREGLPWSELIAEIIAALASDPSIKPGKRPCYRINKKKYDGKEGRPQIYEPTLDNKFLFIERDDIELFPEKSGIPDYYKLKDKDKIKKVKFGHTEVKPVRDLENDYGPFAPYATARIGGVVATMVGRATAMVGAAAAAAMGGAGTSMDDLVDFFAPASPGEETALKPPAAGGAGASALAADDTGTFGLLFYSHEGSQRRPVATTKPLDKSSSPKPP